jgi:flagellar export protein FliJ
LHRWQLNEKRRHLVELERLAQRLAAQIRELEVEIRNEQQVAGSSTEAAMTYGDYARAATGRREKLDASLAELQSQRVVAKEEVAEAYRELKKYELVKVRNQRLANKRRQRQEQQVLDEVGLNQFRRRDDR